ncbi:hypothetical protein GCK72_015001 [Caenorhabditis remanei]|uniref:Uncharacterized protein n=1 Tax=Caenorhabditis remanei TaxID=31234 RepID=A0A6A5GVZ8_CAERE|nr:hypothetical protein GCK72_015001 [Caenorhabditis remanei]KAF1758542.1 hypothetical protein GCK72_015001 [Caenorhabditis remanei]
MEHKCALVSISSSWTAGRLDVCYSQQPAQEPGQADTKEESDKRTYLVVGFAEAAGSANGSVLLVSETIGATMLTNSSRSI